MHRCPDCDRLCWCLAARATTVDVYGGLLDQMCCEHNCDEAVQRVMQDGVCSGEEME